MKLAIIGSRTLTVRHLERFLPRGITEIVSGGAVGIDRCARAYAQEHDIPIKEFLPDYRLFGRGAPLKRNLEIIAYADEVLIFWNGHSRGTAFVINACRQAQKPFCIVTEEQLLEKDRQERPADAENPPR